MPNINVYLTPEEDELIRAFASREGLSKSDAIRVIVSKELEREKKLGV